MTCQPDCPACAMKADFLANRVEVAVDACRKGHVRTVENTRVRKNGERRCLECERSYGQERRQRAS